MRHNGLKYQYHDHFDEHANEELFLTTQFTQVHHDIYYKVKTRPLPEESKGAKSNMLFIFTFYFSKEKVKS